VLALILLWLLPGCLAFAAAVDLLTTTVPNRIALLLLIAFLPAALLAGLAVSEIGWHLATGLSVLLIGMLLFFLGWCGGGDAKLLAVIGLWLGFDHLPHYLLLPRSLAACWPPSFRCCGPYPCPGCCWRKPGRCA
jgi:prepilin peptidase CpaA